MEVSVLLISNNTGKLFGYRFRKVTSMKMIYSILEFSILIPSARSKREIKIDVANCFYGTSVLVRRNLGSKIGGHFAFFDDIGSRFFRILEVRKIVFVM